MLTCLLPPPPVSPLNPTGNFTVSINNGALTTNSRGIVLALNGGPDAKMMAISEDPNFVNVGQIPYSTSTTFTLSSGNGRKTIYAKFYTSWGRTSPVVSSAINLVLAISTSSQGPAVYQVAAPTAIKQFSTRLVFGMRGEDISNLQRILAQDKSIYPEGIISGYFGELTLKAVEAFQEKYHIANPNIIGYGEVGPHTIEKLNQFFVLTGAAVSAQTSVSSQTSAENPAESTARIVGRLEAQIEALQAQLVLILKQQVQSLKAK